MKTLRQIKNKLKSLQESHGQINSFRFYVDPDDTGELENEENQGLKYPLMGVVLQPGTLAERTDTLKLSLFFADLVSEGKGNLLDVTSDQRLIAMDIFAQFWEWCQENDIRLEKSAPFNSFTAKWGSWVSGYQLDITLVQFYSRDTCQVPGASEDAEEDQRYVRILDQDGNVLAALVAGETYTVEVLQEIIQSLDGGTATIIQTLD